jgi:hypothetical protein
VDKTSSQVETAYDIAKRLGLNGDILHILSFPSDIMKNEDSIIKMQTALHRLMRDRVAHLLDKEKVHMPQLAYFYEFGKLHFEVPGWCGGFFQLNVMTCLCSLLPICFTLGD